MWIRSQDKEVLCECVEVYLEEENNNCYQIINDNDWILGEYTTKEKALKVLDVIEKHINGNDVYISVQNRNSVFKMPQDKEVF